MVCVSGAGAGDRQTAHRIVSRPTEAHGLRVGHRSFLHTRPSARSSLHIAHRRLQPPHAVRL